MDGNVVDAIEVVPRSDCRDLGPRTIRVVDPEVISSLSMSATNDLK
jgi:hypothetical protein